MKIRERIILTPPETKFTLLRVRFSPQCTNVRYSTFIVLYRTFNSAPCPRYIRSIYAFDPIAEIDLMELHHVLNYDPWRHKLDPAKTIRLATRISINPGHSASIIPVRISALVSSSGQLPRSREMRWICRISTRLFSSLGMEALPYLQVKGNMASFLNIKSRIYV